VLEADFVVSGLSVNPSATPVGDFGDIGGEPAFLLAFKIASSASCLACSSLSISSAMTSSSVVGGFRSSNASRFFELKYQAYVPMDCFFRFRRFFSISFRRAVYIWRFGVQQQVETLMHWRWLRVVSHEVTSNP
jgi:hypothetical protein